MPGGSLAAVGSWEWQALATKGPKSRQSRGQWLEADKRAVEQLGQFERSLALMAQAQQLKPASIPIRANRALTMFQKRPLRKRRANDRNGVEAV